MAELNEINGFPPRARREHIRNERPAGAQTGAQHETAPDVEHLRRAVRVLDGALPSAAPAKYGYEAGTDLYIMQNEAGRIKVGRSGNCEVRRATLEVACGVKIALLAVMPGRGAEERRVHAALHAYRQMGEWFSREAAAEIERTIGVTLELLY